MCIFESDLTCWHLTLIISVIDFSRESWMENTTTFQSSHFIWLVESMRSLPRQRRLPRNLQLRLWTPVTFFHYLSSITTEIIYVSVTLWILFERTKGQRFSGFCFYVQSGIVIGKTWSLRPTCQTPTLDALLCRKIKGVKRRTCIFYFELILRMLVAQFMRGFFTSLPF